MTTSHQTKDLLTTKKHGAARTKNKKNFAEYRVSLWLNPLRFFVILTCFTFFCATDSSAQTDKSKTKIPARKTKTASQQTVSNLPKVTQIDAEAMKTLLKPKGKPLLVNFWATWCDPCREEFPDLVKIGADYKDKIDVITISLDELSEINNDVPKFLAQMKSNMPAYLLKTPDEGAAIASVSKDWEGGLPFTIFFNAQGETVYIKQGKFNLEFLRAEIEKTLGK